MTEAEFVTTLLIRSLQILMRFTLTCPVQKWVSLGRFLLSLRNYFRISGLAKESDDILACIKQLEVIINLNATAASA